MKKYAVNIRLVVALLLVLVTTGCGSSPSTAFEKVSEYWKGLKGPGYIEGSVLAALITPMFNQSGIRYLIDKMARGAEGEPEIAVLCLATIYEILLDTPSEESRRLREPIEKSRLIELAAVYADKGSNEAIRHSLARFVNRPKKEAATPPSIPVSGTETWEIGGRHYKIHSTQINMRCSKGPMFTVVVDQSRSVVSKIVNPIPDTPSVKPVAKYAFDNGYFAKAQEIQLSGERIPLQDRIGVYIGQTTRDGFKSVNCIDGEFSLQDLGMPAKEENQQVDGTRP